MAEFRVGRGHDGPARVGEFILQDTTFQTPCLASISSSGNNIIGLGSLGRDEALSNEPMIVSLPFVSNVDELPLDRTRESDAFLLPALLSFGSLSPDSPKVILDYQSQVLENLKSQIDPSRTFVRIPPEISPESFSERFTHFLEAGVSGAAFVINGQLGPEDASSFYLRSRLPLPMAAIAMGRIEPGLIPLLHYAGFDIVDASYAHEAATQNIRLWRDSTENIESGSERIFCSCRTCSSIDINEELGSDLILEHNLDLYRYVLSMSVGLMRTGRLRWSVESTSHYSPSLASLLRVVDRKLYAFFEEFTPTIGKVPLPLIGPESYNAPAVRRFRETVASRYSPAPDKQIVLLLPCSARKPYSDSKSHRRFSEVIDAELGNVQPKTAEVILTSPLGLVPRELERIFPAAQYDIPVTGDWDSEEVAIGAKALSTHLNKFKESTVVVAHVSGGYLEIVRAAEPDISQSIIYTSHEDRATSRESLEALRETLLELKDVLALQSAPRTVLREILWATADYQFGKGAGNMLVPENAKLKGKAYRMIICNVDDEQVCSYIAESGNLSLTLEGGRRLAPLGRYWVRLDVESVKGGSVFAVGVQEADYSIRPGDEVIVINQNNEVVGVGRSEMSGREMCELNRGRSVTLRHKVE
ncbi:MAG: DUF5591 domain-containing protein [Candidatus Thorarchaeota archaeon]